eukprot:g4366.t1
MLARIKALKEEEEAKAEGKDVSIEMKNESNKEKSKNDNANGSENNDSKIGIATMKSLTRLAAKARRNRVERKKENVVKNIHFRGASWLDDSASTFCVGCDADFTCYNRRHHCRFCGMLLCNDCSQWRIEGVRACKNCHAELKEVYKRPTFKECLKKPIHPESKFRSVWDVIILLLTFHLKLIVDLIVRYHKHMNQLVLSLSYRPSSLEQITIILKCLCLTFNQLYL